MSKQAFYHQILELEQHAIKPVNLYRFQLNHLFPLKRVENLLSYLDCLGVDALYLSPIFEANHKSLHGYDVINPLKISPEIGGYDAFVSLSEKAKRYNISIIIDLVANHMSTSFSNPWWFDILENGQQSLYCDYFDINWDALQQRLKGKVFIPLLDEPYYEALNNQKIALKASDHGLFFSYFEHQLPCKPSLYFDILSQIKNNKFQRLLKDFKNLENEDDKKGYQNSLRTLKGLWKDLFQDSILKEKINSVCLQITKDHKKSGLLDVYLQKQNFLIEFWQYAPRGINYRRFFDINALAALRMENPETFHLYHSLVFDLFQKGLVQGVRVDHPDGFYDPVRYFKNLQDKYLTACGFEHNNFADIEQRDYKPLYTIVEKILEKEESLPEDWQVHGTVGYEFLNLITHLFVDSSQDVFFDHIYTLFKVETKDPKELLQEEKRAFTFEYMQSEVESLCAKLASVFEEKGLQFEIEQIKIALVELFASFPVYRTYLQKGSTVISSQDKSALYEASDRALSLKPGLKNVLEAMQAIFFKASKKSNFEEEFILRFQQLCPSIMAKGFEDTHLYNYNRFLAFNEVGGFVNQFGISIDNFHERMLLKLKKSPYSWVTASTHDTKRSEGVRLRLAALSELPNEWKTLCQTWHKKTKPLKTHLEKMVSPDTNIEYFIYQTLVGFWPDFDLNQEQRAQYTQRVKDYILKSIREAKKYTNWVNHNISYEKSTLGFIDKILEDQTFYKELCSFVKILHVLGVRNVLSALVLKMGLPAALDIYQGTEFFDFALVDPDNRRAVDFNKRQEALNSNLSEPFDNYNLEKFHIFRCGLNFRKEHKNLIFLGSYIPLKVRGDDENHVIAYARSYKSQTLIVAALRLTSKVSKKSLKNTYLELSSDMQNRSYENIFSKKKVHISHQVELGPLLEDKHYLFFSSC